jgi:hypothetical protein
MIASAEAVISAMLGRLYDAFLRKLESVQNEAFGERNVVWG